jgi:hypothetical protein
MTRSNFESKGSSGRRGRGLVLAAITVALSLSFAWTVIMAVVLDPAWLAERVPWTLLLVSLSWALYAGYTPVRWLWVAMNLLLFVALAVALLTGGELPLWLGAPMGFGYAFVGLTLALSRSVGEFLEDRKRRRDAERRAFDPAYTAMFAFIGCSYLWALGGLWPRGLLGWAPEDRLFTVMAIGSFGGLALLNLFLAGYRSARLPFAREVTTVGSFLLPVQFPLGTAAFVYWLLKVRPHEGVPSANDGADVPPSGQRTV